MALLQISEPFAQLLTYLLTVQSTNDAVLTLAARLKAAAVSVPLLQAKAHKLLVAVTNGTIANICNTCHNVQAVPVMNGQLLYPLQPCQQCINCTFDTVVDATARQNLGNLTPDMQAGSGDNSVCDAAPPSQSRFQHMPAAELQSEIVPPDLC